MPTITGTAGDDTLVGTSADDTISGLGGNDIIHGNGGNDTLDGGDGDDTVYVIGGTTSADTGTTIVRLGLATADGSVVTGGEWGLDHLIVDYSGLTQDVIFSNPSHGYDGASSVAEIGGVQRLSFSGAGTLDVTTGSGNDVVYGVGVRDSISTGAGDDTIYAYYVYSSFSQYSSVDGGEGIDTLYFLSWYDLSEAVVLDVNLPDGVTIGAGETQRAVRGIESLYGFTTGAGDDVITLHNSGAVMNVIETTYGSDTVTVYGGATAATTAWNKLNLGSGDMDHLIVDFSAATEQVVYRSDYSSFGGTWIGGVQVHEYSEIELVTVTSGSANDELNANGASWSQYYDGRGGDDLLIGGYGADTLLGGSGNDSLTGKSGDDLLSGQEGDDLLVGGAGGDTLIGADGRDEIYSGESEPDGYASFNPSFPEYYHSPLLDRSATVDSISGGNGDDFVSVGYGDSADGGEHGEHGDELFISLAAAPTGMVADFRNTTLTFGGGTITGFERVNYVEGSQFADVITFDAGPFPLYPAFGGPGGGREISGLGGNDQITGGYYTNNIWGGEGNDLLDGQASQYLMYLDGGAGADTLIGNRHGSHFNGGDGDDIIQSGDGADLVTGGAGADIFRDTVAGHDGDTITDLVAGDVLIFSDASVENFTFSVVGNTLNYTGGSLTLSGGITGTLVKSAAAGGGVQLAFGQATEIQDVRNDFNGDGRSDILWRDGSGTLSEWLGQADGSFAWNPVANYSIPASWSLVASGDFNNDGRDDILWRDGSGTLSEWLGQTNGSFAWNANATYAVPVSTTLVSTGDFNNDGRDDILWRDSAGTLSEWLGQANGSFAWNPVSNYQIPTSWTLVGSGDFNNDGRDDILWRDNAGTFSEWLGQANGSFAWNASAVYQIPTSWTFEDTGDFNGDGRDDVLWRDGNGTLSEWLGQANGSFAWNPVVNYQVSPSWTLETTGDFNKDGRDDIIWRDGNGTLSEWLGQADGSFAWNPGAVYGTPASWQIQPDLL